MSDANDPVGSGVSPQAADEVYMRLALEEASVLWMR